MLVYKNKYIGLPVFIKDPKSSEKSVSLTLLIISFAALSVLGVLQALDKIQNVGPFMEIFIISTSLYFGRRLDFKSIINRKGKR